MYDMLGYPLSARNQKQAGCSSGQGWDLFLIMDIVLLGWSGGEKADTSAVVWVGHGGTQGLCIRAHRT